MPCSEQISGGLIAVVMGLSVTLLVYDADPRQENKTEVGSDYFEMTQLVTRNNII